VDIERMFLERIVDSPHLIQKTLARQDQAGRFHELFEDLKFSGSQLHRLGMHMHFMAGNVHP